MKTVTIVVLTSIILVIAIVQVFQLANLKERIVGLTTNNPRAAGTGQIDMTGWTDNEKMNYEMHGTIPSRASGGSGLAGNGMVGGC